jgi:hypothetical protein
VECCRWSVGLGYDCASFVDGEGMRLLEDVYAFSFSFSFLFSFFF